MIMVIISKNIWKGPFDYVVNLAAETRFGLDEKDY